MNEMLDKVNASIVPFETANHIHYYTDEERTEMGIGPEHMLVGEGVCPLCGEKVSVVSDTGVRHGRDGNRTWNYLANHYSDKETQILCHGSERMFIHMINNSRVANG